LIQVVCVRMKKRGVALLLIVAGLGLYSQIRVSTGASKYLAASPTYPISVNSTSPLCVYVHTDNQTGSVYGDEFAAVLRTWADSNTYFYTYANLNIPEGRGRAYKLDQMFEKHFGEAVLWAYPGMSREVSGRIIPTAAKSIPMWHHVQQRLSTDFAHCRWFMKIDTDSWVNRVAIEEQLRGLSSEVDHYIGALSIYKHMNNMNGTDTDVVFGSGGTGYVMSRSLLRKFDVHGCWEMCKRVPIIYEDANIGRCLALSFRTLWPDQWRSVFYDNVFPYKAGRWIARRHHCLPCFQTMHKLYPQEIDAMQHRVETMSRAHCIPGKDYCKVVSPEEEEEEEEEQK